jgi:hypothetical protein
VLGASVTALRRLTHTLLPRLPTPAARRPHVDLLVRLSAVLCDAAPAIARLVKSPVPAVSSCGCSLAAALAAGVRAAGVPMVIDAAMGTAGAFCSSSDAASGVLGTVAGAPMPAPAGRCVVVNPSHPAAGVCKEAAARAGVVAALRYKLESRYAEIASAAALAIAELARCDAVVGGVRRAPFRDLLLEDRTAIALAACLEGVLLRPREEREQLIEAVSHAIATLCSAGVGYLPVDRCGQLLRTAFLPLVPSLLLSHQLTCASRQQPTFESLPALVSLIDACAVLLPQVATTAAHRTVIVAALLSLIDPRGPAVSCARAAVTEVTEASAAASRSPHPASAATVLQEIAARTMPYTEVVSAAVRCIRVLVECGEWAADAAAAGAWRSAAALLIWGAGEDSVVECCDVRGVLIFSYYFYLPHYFLATTKNSRASVSSPSKFPRSTPTTMRR